MSQTNKVNCFLAGSPKCGTTALVKYLSTHADFLVSSHKESNFFMEDAPNIRHVTNYNEYNLLFGNFASEKKIFCDASIFYLFSEVAIKNVYNYNKDAKIILMFRDPMEMIPSFHAQILYTLEEDISDLEEAWISQKDRIKGDKIPKHSRASQLLNYSEIAKYNKQLLNVYKYFPKEQVKVILFDDLKESSLKVYKDVLEFLEIPYDGKTDFPRVNEAKIAKSNLLNKFVNRPPKFMKTISKFLLKLSNKSRFGILEKIDNLNRTKRSKEEIPQSLKEKIISEYNSDVNSLSNLINRDLNHWLK